MSAYKGVICFARDTLRVAVPPANAADIRAEYFRLLLRDGLNDSTTLLTAGLIAGKASIYFYSATMGAYGIDGNAQLLADSHIAITLQAQLPYLFFLLICHGSILLHWIEGVPPSAVTGKKAAFCTRQ